MSLMTTSHACCLVRGPGPSAPPWVPVTSQLTADVPRVAVDHLHCARLGHPVRIMFYVRLSKA